ncbi:MAG: Tad domain-containing protein [Bdellovibrionaceae bacterium]|nr:Tad domain-containing protein [Pseudobdellovibrionaceae bacterium]
MKLKPFLGRFRNTQGQMAIFVALIFQVLFLFFAMVVNVGLLVHHKINLQNSVDFAAYYGAMKQAESMNAIAHINYQIRQSWKLLAWRYRIIGSAGTTEVGNPPYRLFSSSLNDAYEDSPMDPASEAPAFCVAYTPFEEVPPQESLCKKGGQASTINLFAVPAATGLVGVSRGIQAAAIAALKNILTQCEYIGPFNWLLLARFKVAFVIDHGNRKRVINMLANGLSGQGAGGEPNSDFLELDGSRVSIGIRKTLEKNLTIQNRNSLGDFKVFNSLGDANCGVTNPSFEKPPKWLTEILVKPAFSTSAADCDGVRTSDVGAMNKLVFYPVDIENPDPDQPKHWRESVELRDEIAALRPFVNYSSPPFETSLGMEKNPWCMAYVGVKATTKPKVPFMPFGEVTMTASAYAKPFGGRIGPWYKESWAPGVASVQSNIGKRLDELTPERYNPGAGISPAMANSPMRVPNYSRFPGDLKGLRSRALAGLYDRALFQMSSRWAPNNDIILNSVSVPAGPDNSPSFSHWSEIAKNFKTGNPSKDILAWNSFDSKAPQMRLLELSALAPDIFDTTYYSIEPNFYQVYYQKIMDHKKIVNANDLDVPSDLGARMDDKKFEGFNIKNQIEVQNKVLEKIDNIGGSTLQYLLKDVDHVLTSWVPNSLLEYDFAPNLFGKCGPGSRPKEKYPIPGDCVAGGRIGFSVKLVSGDYLLRSDLSLGGKSAQGPINNPPPDNF